MTSNKKLYYKLSLFIHNLQFIIGVVKKPLKAKLKQWQFLKLLYHDYSL
jgi:hypothetical protein